MTIRAELRIEASAEANRGPKVDSAPQAEETQVLAPVQSIQNFLI
jgi:hypothetical protein